MAQEPLVASRLARIETKLDDVLRRLDRVEQQMGQKWAASNECRNDLLDRIGKVDSKVVYVTAVVSSIVGALGFMAGKLL